MLEIQRLSLDFLRYRGLWRRESLSCLQGVSLTLSRGELHAVVGASGAGKSLMALAVMGLLPANTRMGGTLMLDGTSLDAARQAALRGTQLAWIPQSIASLDPLARCGHQVRWAARRAGVSRERSWQAAGRALQRHGLDAPVGHAYPHSLSGGMARRVLLAIASVGGAEWLIADEPTVGLEEENRRSVLVRLRQLADAGKGVLLITHDLRHALAVADRVTVFHDGTSLETAEASAFRGQGERLATAYARTLWRALPDNDFLLPTMPIERASWEASLA
ncbi:MULTISPECIES: ATP-binding cassette domain-containing protein [Halomonadaceae]|uniref:ATP-binding cassette domain-containing protein n=1 Tax=Halomonadaceae TaxID=28256 RepID=UPI00159A0D7F|nr:MULTISPECIES: ATP-binding cassette domain-containing protein [Halomonas]QJQ95747.1 ABC transporter ATP-binding protein [Halomonas sp. PA5]